MLVNPAPGNQPTNPLWFYIPTNPMPPTQPPFKQRQDRLLTCQPSQERPPTHPSAMPTQVHPSARQHKVNLPAKPSEPLAKPTPAHPPANARSTPANPSYQTHPPTHLLAKPSQDNSPSNQTKPSQAQPPKPRHQLTNLPAKASQKPPRPPASPLPARVIGAGPRG